MTKSNVSRTKKPAPKGIFPKTAEPANDAAKPQIPRHLDGSPTQEVEAAVLNAPRIGNLLSIGDLVMKLIAPNLIVEESPCAWEPPEAATLRQLSMELTVLAEGLLEHRGLDAKIDLASMVRGIAERASASEELARRLRVTRFGTSYTWGGVAAKNAAIT